MSATSTTSPISPIDRKDIRSAAQPFKRDKDHGSKWANGQRPSPGVNFNWAAALPEDELSGGSESQREKVRPRKQWSQVGRTTDRKPHANVHKANGCNAYDLGGSRSRVVNKVDAILETQDHTTSPLSRSLLELLPNHVNNTNLPISTILRSEEILYSFDNKGPSPSIRGTKVELEGLVEKAEKKWVSEQTEKIVRGEYEVLDEEGHSTVLKRKEKGKKSPKQKATIKNASVGIKAVEDDDEGFELI